MVAPGTRNPPDVVTTEIPPRAGPVPQYFPLFYRESTNIQVFSITVLTRFCRGDGNGPLRKKLDLLRSAFATFFFDRNFFGRIFFDRPKKIDQHFFGQLFFSTKKLFDEQKNFDRFFFDRYFFQLVFFRNTKITNLICF